MTGADDVALSSTAQSRVGEAGPLAIALATALGCVVARPGVVLLAGVVMSALGVAAFGARVAGSAVVPAVVAAVAGAALAAHAWSGLVPPPAQRFDDMVDLVTDPEAVPGGLRMEVVAAGRHSQLVVRSEQSVRLRDAMAGERVRIVGWLEPVRDDAWLARRHIASQLTAETIGPVEPGHAAARLANMLRRQIQRGADHLGASHRPLYLGLVLGDDRGQSDTTVNEFRAAGLSHLLVVSGQNLAFVLALVAPVLGRLQLRGRLVGTLAVVGFFALVTRFEPSVLRATTMVAIAAVAMTLGRPASRLRVLAYAATVCLLLDPFLVMSVGFGLSLSACVGIIVLGPVLTERLPGPALVREPLAITLAAEVGVAPLLIATFDGVPLASIPANLLAEAVAGFVMSWGMSVGLVAGSLPWGLGRLAMAPADAAVAWIAGVAAWASDLPLGRIDGRWGAVGAAAAVVFLGYRRWSRAPARDRPSRAPSPDV